MRHPLSDAYADGRVRLLELGDQLTESDGDIMTSTCPAWSVKDVFAHLAGISTDILAGNTENAATEEWADGHVADRSDTSLAEVLAEWRTAGAEVSTLVETVGDAFPFQLFVDQWTHEWDIRSALGDRASAEPDLRVYAHFLSELLDRVAERATDAGAPALTLHITEAESDPRVLGVGDPAGDLHLGLFEFGRVTMGRRSRRQLAQLDWPFSGEATTAVGAHVDALVFWSPAEQDIVDPVT